MARKALIVYGGWDGHQPKQVAEIFLRLLKEDGFDAEAAHTLDALADEAKLMKLSLIVPVWTMGTITKEQLDSVTQAVRSGVGIAGCHGGMCDSFREATEWQFMTGGQWVAHPGNILKYRVNVLPVASPLVEGIGDFDVETEQYYLHVDPAVKVYATTRFPTADGPHAGNGPVDMPVIWTKYYGQGRVYYNSLGHQASTVETEPVRTLMRRGFDWAARK